MRKSPPYVDRSATIALACALSAHGLILAFWPAPDTDRVVLPLPAEEESTSSDATRPLPEPVPIAIEFLAPEIRHDDRLPPANLALTRIAKLPPSPPTPNSEVRGPSTTGAPASASQELSRSLVAQPGSESWKVQSPVPGEESPDVPAGSFLRMRDGGPATNLDPLAGSGLEAAIAAAAAHPPSGSARGDLLGNPEGKEPIGSGWRPSGGGTMRATGQPFDATVDRDGRIHFKDRRNVAIDGVKISKEYLIPVIVGHFDLTDAFMASVGDVLYPYRKLKLMDESREQRALMATQATTESLREALDHFPKRLMEMWRDPSYTLAERKLLLFALWDECAEEGSEEQLRTARSIRASTLRFVRRVLPVGDANAYSEQELSALNASRQSTQLFAPYARGSGEGQER